MSARSGELFAGVGGLGMAVDAVFDATPAWFAEFDAAPSKVLAYRFPGVPNLGDVRAVDWASLEHADILCGGFPCQDVSLAGRRRGMTATSRSGLWSEFARAIDIIRPDWVVIENVRGLLSADAAGDVEPCPWCLGDDGEQHALRALGAVLGDLADLGFDAEWTGARASDIGAPHGRFRVFILAWPAAHTGRGEPERRGGYGELAGASGAGETVGAERKRDGDAARNSGATAAVTLLPTPRTTDMNGAGAHGTGGLDLRTSVALLPTPGAYDGDRGGPQHPDKRRTGGHSVSLQDVSAHLMPTPRATRGGSNTEMAYAMGGKRSDVERPQGVVVPGTGWGPYSAAVARWEAAIGRPAPSPVLHDGKGGKARLNPALPEWMMGWPKGWVTSESAEDWRERLRIRRGGDDRRPVGMRGSVRRREIGLTRSEQLKVCGNGVVPQQAEYALRSLLNRPGVPALKAEVSA